MNMLHLFQCRRFLFPLSRGDAGVLLGEVEIVGIGILKARLVARLPGQPLEEVLQLRQCGVQGRLAQLLPGPLASLLGQMPLERNRLLKMKALKSRYRVYSSNRLRALATASTVGSLCRLASFRYAKYLRLIRSFFGLCFVMVSHSYSKSLFTVGSLVSLTRPRASENVMFIFPLTCSNFAKLTRRKIINSQSGQIPIRFPKLSVIG